MIRYFVEIEYFSIVLKQRNQESKALVQGHGIYMRGRIHYTQEEVRKCHY